MSTKTVTQPKSAPIVPIAKKKDVGLLQQYGRDSIQFAGTPDALYDRHLIFDRVIDPKAASARERFEAFAHSVRDVIAQRWVKTKSTYEQQNAKRIYYPRWNFFLGVRLPTTSQTFCLIRRSSAWSK